MTEEYEQQDIVLTDIVSTSSGQLQGFKDEGNEVEVFLGIPYAEPPVGKLRFKPTVPLKSPNVSRLCIEHAPAAPQTTMPFDTLMCVQIDHQSEDCLFLNIWKPKDASPTNKKPVIVWIHPGACMSGSSSQPFWDGTNLSRNDTIIVNLNYRLGALGWMGMDHLSPDLTSTSNLGLLDQIAALRWVQENIEKFGGDASNVTAFGSSAGSSCVMAIILSPNTSGLFKKIVLQSPPMFMVSPQDWSQFKGDIFARSLGLDKSHFLQDLQSAPIDTILDAQTFMTTWPNFLEGLAPISPAQDAHVIPSTLIQHFFHKPLPAGYEDLEIMIGYTRDEFNFFFPFLPNFQDMDDSIFVRTYFTHIFGPDARRAYEIYKEEILPPQSPPFEITRYMCSDVMCRIATLLTAENLSLQGHKVYLYEWDYESNDVQNVIKAAHMVDSVFSWDNLVYWTDNPFLGPGDDFERDRIAKQISLAIINFARSNDPNHDGIPEWPTYLTNGDVRERNALIFDREVRVEQNVYDIGVQLWKTVLKDYVKSPLFPVAKVVETTSSADVFLNKKRKLD